MTPSKACIDNIKRFEGCRLSAYPDPATHADPWTIGYGATGPGIKQGVTWTQQQAEDRLKADVERFGVGVAALLHDAPTTQGQFDAMTSFAFNAGLRNLKDSTLLKKHLARDHAGAAAQFGSWVYANHKVMPGLVTRREAEAGLYRS